MKSFYKPSGHLLTLTLVLIQPGGALGEPIASVDPAPEAATIPRFGGPNSVDGQLEENSRTSDALSDLRLPVPQSYSDWKECIRETYGFNFGLDYTAGFLAPTSSISGKDIFASGAVRFYGNWDLIGRDTGNTGGLVWSVQNRHGYTDPPYSGAAADMGFAGALFNPLSNVGTKLVNLYWKQKLYEGRLEVIAGFVDATDWADINITASPWTGFSNWAFSTGSGTIGVPDDGALGFNINAMLTDNLYSLVGLADANADSSNPFDGFDTFFNDHEYFTSVEVGWTSSQERFYLDNTHVTLWHIAERKNAGFSEGWGLNFSHAHSVGEKWMYFLRAGYADDGASVYQKSVSIGGAYHLNDGVSLVGLGFNWNEPNEDTFGPGLGDQYAVELFTRLRLTPHFEVIPNIQLVGNPALDPSENAVLAFGLRARIFF